MKDENNYLKQRTVCKKCHNEIRRKNNNNTKTENEIITTPQQPIIDKINNNNVSPYENRANVVIGPRNVGKTYNMLKVLEKTGNKRSINIITRSPNQYPNYKTSNGIKPINKYKGSIVVFDDMLGAKNSQSYFALPRQSIRNNSDRLILFKQTLRDVQSMYQDIEASDMTNLSKCVGLLGVKKITIYVLI